MLLSNIFQHNFFHFTILLHIIIDFSLLAYWLGLWPTFGLVTQNSCAHILGSKKHPYCTQFEAEGGPYSSIDNENYCLTRANPVLHKRMPIQVVCMTVPTRASASNPWQLHMPLAKVLWGFAALVWVSWQKLIEDSKISKLWSWW